MTTAIDKTERIKRVRDIRRWGTSEDAENAALSIIGLLPDSSPTPGIFPTGVDEDTDSGDGGISFQRSTDNGVEIVTIVEIDSSGCMTGWALRRVQLQRSDPLDLRTSRRLPEADPGTSTSPTILGTEGARRCTCSVTG